MSRTALAICAFFTMSCGRTITTTANSQSRLAPPDAYKCVTRQLDSLGFQRTSHDDEAYRVTARKVNPKITFSNTQFRRAWDRIEAQAINAPTGTNLNVQASTVAEYFSQQGLVYNQLATSDDAKRAAQTLLARCSAAVPPAAAPAAAAPPAAAPSVAAPQ